MHRVYTHFTLNTVSDINWSAKHFLRTKSVVCKVYRFSKWPIRGMQFKRILRTSSCLSLGICSVEFFISRVIIFCLPYILFKNDANAWARTARSRKLASVHQRTEMRRSWRSLCDGQPGGHGTGNADTDLGLWLCYFPTSFRARIYAVLRQETRSTQIEEDAHIYELKWILLEAQRLWFRGVDCIHCKRCTIFINKEYWLWAGQ